jgi:hypothetical protein
MVADILAAMIVAELKAGGGAFGEGAETLALHQTRLRLHGRGRARPTGGLLRGVPLRKHPERHGSGGGHLIAAERIRELNDTFRTTFQGGRILITVGVQGRECVYQATRCCQTAPVGKVCSARDEAFRAALYPGFLGGM